MPTIDREQERERIRAKLSAEDLDFMDAMKQLFVGSRMVGIRFSDGETIGKLEESNRD